MSKNTNAHYALKHIEQSIFPEIAEALERKAVEGRISCAAVHAIAASFHITPLEVGTQADLIELRLTRCILGLFGHERQNKGNRKNLDDQVSISLELKDTLIQQAKDNKISCIDCWNIAKRLGLKPSHVSSACEKMSIKIKPCQIGAF
ncbi:hypothetical protein SAMN02746065_103110 [Desulfocicer vacuolatum DSM 3385]|uniref:Uncharacterized protein n=1 Tax=Desulfocicer vacuolatum DSM 3385 TaxID=1121400 RepID=A0A1W1ZQT8_9BACT|nr:hypothetical protein [Desulfocicer vacuolatum]SMC50789.1 hypothetical protein SAMN02746065_103110 [Desulfocicer vacuolatum DSM 3385]